MAKELNIELIKQLKGCNKCRKIIGCKYVAVMGNSCIMFEEFKIGSM